MITDALLAPLLAMVSYVVNLLPEGSPLPLPALDGLWNWLMDFDTLIPVYGPVVVMVTLLSAVLVFIVVRLVLTVWNLIYP